MHGSKSYVIMQRKAGRDKSRCLVIVRAVCARVPSDVFLLCDAVVEVTYLLS